MVAPRQDHFGQLPKSGDIKDGFYLPRAPSTSLEGMAGPSEHTPVTPSEKVVGALGHVVKTGHLLGGSTAARPHKNGAWSGHTPPSVPCSPGATLFSVHHGSKGFLQRTIYHTWGLSRTLEAEASVLKVPAWRS